MIALNGSPCHRAELHVPWRGRWVAKAALDGATAPSGRATLTWGRATLIGTVDPTGGGTWQGEAFATIVGSSALPAMDAVGQISIGWARVLPAGWVQNDIGLQGIAVAQQLATLAGEVLTAPPTAFRLLRTSYARLRATAARSLETILAPGQDWWVEYAGTTTAGMRIPIQAPPMVEVLEYNAADGWADLDAEDVGQTLVGSVIAPAPPRRLEALRITELHAYVDGSGQRIRVSVEAL